MSNKHPKKAAFVTLGILVAVFAAIYFVVTSQSVQMKVISFLTDGSLRLTPHIRLLKNTLSAENIHFKGASGALINAEKAEIKYNPLGLLRGRLIITNLLLKGFDANIPASVEKEKTLSKKLSVKKLLFLRNLQIDEGRIENVSIFSGQFSKLRTDTILLHFAPRFTGDVALSVNLQGAFFLFGEKTASIGLLEVKGKTNLQDWTDIPPFINSLNGSLAAQDIAFEDIKLASLNASLAVKDGKYKLEDFKLKKEAGQLTGSVEIDSNQKTYKGDVRIPEPIHIPTIGSDNPTIDTEGYLSGNIMLEGKGLSLRDSHINGVIELKQAHTDLPDLNLKSEFQWNNGITHIDKAQISLGNGSVTANGEINIPSKRMLIEVSGTNIPLDGVFGRFGDKNFHPIFGTADATATITGWGRDFNVHGEANTTTEGGYYKIRTERAHATVSATYDQLTLIGDINDFGKRSGNITLKIKYGKKLPGQPRPKDLFIEANAIDNDLGRSFRDYNLTGIGNAHMILEGPQKSFKSKIDAVIGAGSFGGINFEKVKTTVDMLYKKISFTSGEIAVPNMEPIVFTSPLYMDFDDAGFRMHGHPVDYISLDAQLTAKTGTWNFKEAGYHDLTVKGTYSPLSTSNLTFAGSIDGASLSPLKKVFRDATGRFDINLKLSGQSTNPDFHGNISFNNNSLYLRSFNKRLEEIKGRLLFEGKKISSDELTGTIEDGPFFLSGFVKLFNLAPEDFDITFKGSNLRYTLPERTFRAEFDTSLALKGTSKSSLLSGEITLLEGRYTKDFSIFDSLKKTEEKKESLLPANDNLKLNVKIRNTGDLSIKNNLGQIWLTADLDVRGTAAHPLISGSVETPEGKIHYLGRDFVITKGFVEFRAPHTEPYLEITAEHEVPNMPDLVVYVTVRGRINNLTLDLSSSKAMEQKDIISLLLFGITEQDIRNTQSSSNFGQSLAASQVGALLEHPITEFTKLDSFRLEGPTDTTSSTSSSKSATSNISRVYMKKQLSDRLNFEFMTNLSLEDAQQIVRAEYMLTDFLLINGERNTTDSYRFNVILRFRER